MRRAIISTFEGYNVRCKKCGKVKPKEEFTRYGIAHLVCRDCMDKSYNLGVSHN